MGIDIYARWRNQTTSEAESQYTGFRIDKGDVGYLREAYHGGPYATKELVIEAFDSESGEAAIPAATLRERLPKAIAAAIERCKLVYKKDADDEETKMCVKSLKDFVALCERKEKELGEPCVIICSA